MCVIEIFVCAECGQWPASSSPWPSLALLLHAGTKAGCPATVVSPRHLLTATSCLQLRGRGPEPAEWVVFAGPASASAAAILDMERSQIPRGAGGSEVARGAAAPAPAGGRPQPRQPPLSARAVLGGGGCLPRQHPGAVITSSSLALSIYLKFKLKASNKLYFPQVTEDEDAQCVVVGWRSHQDGGCTLDIFI